MESYLQVDGLTKSFGDLLLFENISFGIAQGQRVGLIAKNGTGKSTLLNILSGEEGYDSGRVVYRNDLRVGYLQQAPTFPGELTVLEACFHSNDERVQLIAKYNQMIASNELEGMDEILTQMDVLKAWDYEQNAKQILSQLNITDFNQTINTLSGGQLKRVALANSLIVAPDLLIMDEPTNHLDIEMTEWLENYLQRAKLSLLMVTHDRYFLDRVCSVIIEIDRKQIFTYKGNYSFYLNKRQERVDQLNSEIEKANNLYRTELEWMRRMPQARGHKARYREDAFYELEKVAKQSVQTDNVKLAIKSTYIGSKIFEAVDLSKAFGERIILDKFTYTFSRYEKMGIIGNNGAGKSTFIKLLIGDLKADSGQLDVGETVRFGYYSQDGLQFDEHKKVIEVIRDVAEVVELGNGKQLTATQLLQHFLFTPETQYNYVAKLSGGERRRLYLCSVLMKNPNFLVLDEPTNDLDIVTLNILEEYLASFSGCLIVVSHDRYFMDKVVDRILVFNGEGDIRDFPGNYSDYRDWKKLKLQKEKEETKKQEKKSVKKERADKGNKITYKERLELEKLEKEIEDIEAEKEGVESELCSGKLTSEALTEKSKKIATLIALLDEKTMRWLELSEKEGAV